MTDSTQGQRHDRSALILYGSETGNSQDVAGELGRIAERLRFVTRVAPMDRVEIIFFLQYTVVIVAISTTGQGEFPKNARKLWRSLLRKRLPLGCLDHVSFTTFGLGDSSYPKFNWAARKLHKRLEQLGAKEFYPRGEADEQHQDGIDGTFLSWSLDFRKHLLSLYPLPDGVTSILDDFFLEPRTFLELDDTPDQLRSTKPLFPRKEDVEISNSNQPNAISCQSRTLLPVEGGFKATLGENKRLTPATHFQDVRQLTFIIDAEDTSSFSPGEVLKIWPKNPDESVSELISLMGWELYEHHQVKIQSNSPVKEQYHDDFHIIEDSTLREILINNIDMNAIPSRYFFSTMSKFTSDETHKERLQEFADPAFIDEYYDYTTRPRRTILEVLQDFPSVKFPFRWVLSIFPLIRCRDFSIAGSSIETRTQNAQNFTRKLVQVQLLIAILKYRTVLQKPRQGLCSRYISSLPAGTDMVLSRGEATFKFDAVKEAAIPLILIGPGTGIAPLRFLLRERARLNPLNSSQPSSLGNALLFFGSRNKAADFFYEKEWSEESLNVEVHPAFSRDQREKIYVQDVIRREKMSVWGSIEKGARIIVCGSSGNMPKAVKEAILFVLREEGRFGEEEAGRMVERWEQSGRYVQETW